MNRVTIFGISEERLIFHESKDFFEKGLDALRKIQPPAKKLSQTYCWELSFPLKRPCIERKKIQ